jgi:hypothetical protein
MEMVACMVRREYSREQGWQLCIHCFKGRHFGWLLSRILCEWCLDGRKEFFVNVLGWTIGIYLECNKGSRMSKEFFSHQALCQPMESGLCHCDSILYPALSSVPKARSKPVGPCTSRRSRQVRSLSAPASEPTPGRRPPLGGVNATRAAAPLIPSFSHLSIPIHHTPLRRRRRATPKYFPLVAQ